MSRQSMGCSGELTGQLQKPPGYQGNLETSSGPDGSREHPKDNPDLKLSNHHVPERDREDSDKGPMTHAWEGTDRFLLPPQRKPGCDVGAGATVERGVKRHWATGPFLGLRNELAALFEKLFCKSAYRLTSHLLAQGFQLMVWEPRRMLVISLPTCLLGWRQGWHGFHM